MKDRNKVFLIGEGSYPIYERAFYDAFLEMDNCEVDHYWYGEAYKKSPIFGSLIKRVEDKLACGLIQKLFNLKIVRIVKAIKPDIVFIYSGRLIAPSTVKKIKENCQCVMLYCNDDPFSKKYKNYYWKKYRDSLKYSDITYVYRNKNIKDAYGYGANKVKLLRSYYIRDRNFCMTDMYNQRKKTLIGFIGHYEADDRGQYISKLLENDVDLVLSDVWKRANIESNHGNITYVDNSMKNYNKYLNMLDIAIVFLSTLNNDTYTRRCFEIPATKTMMLCQYSDDIASMFEEDKEIVFFRNEDEFVQKAVYYLNHVDEARKIGENGYQRLMRDGHEACDRVKQIVEDYCEICNQH
ncbi:glycosyltransferase [Butyrivibrio fibrisolvens]|uniref:glycosyltransferase family protein n=1 Tax=Butyrivibrio fibrisolvens TaxID=831 RepID=UPI0003B5BEE4|nr:glycosyltransferase [Butyrivibrio fibrisolvens]